MSIAAEGIESATLQSLLLEGCSGSVSFGVVPALRKLELTSRHLPVPDSIANLHALQKLVRVRHPPKPNRSLEPNLSHPTTSSLLTLSQLVRSEPAAEVWPVQAALLRDGCRYPLHPADACARPAC